MEVPPLDWGAGVFGDAAFDAVSLLGYGDGLDFSQPVFSLDLPDQHLYTHALPAFAAGAIPTVNPQDLGLDVQVAPEMLAMALLGQAPVGLGVNPVSPDPALDMYNQGMPMYDGAGFALPTGFLLPGPSLPANASNLDAPMSLVALSKVSHVSDA